MADYSEEELYDKLENVLHGTKRFLCQVFQRRWREETRTDWRKLSISKKVAILGNNAFDNAKCIESIARSPGNLEDFEPSLLSTAILSFRRVEKYAKENDAVTTIKILRESLASKYSGKISSLDYIRETEKVCNSLECLGIKKKEIFDLISQVKRRRPEYVRIDNVVGKFQPKKEFKEKRLNMNWTQNRDVNAPGENLFQKGIKHTYFSETCQLEDWVQATSYFRQAANKNHVEATTFLAICYQYDCYGVEKDLDEAKKLFEKAARMNTKSPGAFTLYKCNIGVAEAQRCLGSIYFDRALKDDSESGTEYCQEADLGGTGSISAVTAENFAHAKFWLHIAMENGDGLAAYKLAKICTVLSFDKFDSQMQMCLKESMNLKYGLAFVPLIKHYLDSLELDKATYIRKIGRTMYFSSQDEDKHFDQAVASMGNIRRRWERQVENFEREYGLDIKGLTFRQRLVRPLCYSSVNNDKFDIFGESMFSAHTFRCFGTADFIEGDPMLEIYPYQELFQLMEEKQELTESDMLQVLEWTYQILIQGPRLVPMRELTEKGIGKILESLRQEEKYKEQGELDEKLRLCCAGFNLFSHCDETKSIQMLVEGTQRYPDNCTYRTFLCLYLGQKENWKWGLRTAEEGLKVDPKNVELMYLEAVFFSFLNADTKFRESEAKYYNILRNVLENDPIYPDAIYSLSALFLHELEIEVEPSPQFLQTNSFLMAESFELGSKAESDQLDWFLPYRMSSLKLKIEMAYLSYVRNTESGAKILKDIRRFKEDEPVLERKMYLRSPTRNGLIKLHRQNIKDRRKGNMADSKKELDKYVEVADSPKLQQTLSEGLGSLKPITLLEINPMAEHVYENRLLELIILEEPDFNSGFLASVAEDKDGDVIRVHFYNFKDEENITEKLSVGSRIAVMNPYLSMAKSDFHSCIRIDDFRCVVYQRKVRNMCGFCGEEDSSHHCSNCQRNFCSSECEEHDVQTRSQSRLLIDRCNDDCCNLNNLTL